MPENTPRVGYLLKKFPRLSETFILNEILELQRQGLDVHVLSLYMPDDGRFHSAVAELVHPITYVPELGPRDLFRRFAERRGDLRRLMNRIGTALDYLFDLGEADGLPVMKRALGVALEVERLELDHIHAHFATIASRTALAVKLLTGVSYSITAHAKDIYRSTVQPEAFARLVDESECLVTVCESNRDHILAELAPGRDQKVRRLYNGVDLERFRQREPRVPRSTGEAPSILAVGRLVQKKGFAILIRACAELRNQGVRFQCRIVGDGEQRAELLELIASLNAGAVVELAGALPQDRILPLYAQADVVALPCVQDQDGNRDALPTTLLEALACGLPVVSTPVVGVPEIVIDGQNGRLVPEGDVAALAAALKELLLSAELRERFGRAGRLRAEHCFDLRQNVRALRELFPSPARTPPKFVKVVEAGA